MFTKDTFCILPWSSIQINPSGDFKVCCFSGVSEEQEISSERASDHGMCLDENGNVMNILTHSIQDALNSSYHKQVRLAQSRGERHPICKVCWDRDDANKTGQNDNTNSLRFARTYKQLPNLENAITFEKAPTFLTADGALNELPISLDLRFSNVCNMKCIMCDSRYSTLWYKDEVEIFGKTAIDIDSKTYQLKQVDGVYKTDMPTWHDSEKWWKDFDEIKHRVRHLYITGGEPFIVKGHDKLLDILIEGGYSKEVILEYDTNLSVINDKILNKLNCFKRVILSVSCDDVNEQYELIRFPGKFNTLLTNLEKLSDRNFKIRHLSSCVGIYSFYSPIRVYDYFSKLGYNNPDKITTVGLDGFSFRMLRGPYHCNIAALPKHLKLKLIDLYTESNLPERWKNTLCGYLKNNMDTYTEEQCIDTVKIHIKYLDDLDKGRGTDWRKTLPEVVELLKEYL